MSSDIYIAVRKNLCFNLILYDVFCGSIFFFSFTRLRATSMISFVFVLLPEMYVSLFMFAADQF